jgi:predicted Zn-dependent peptidase
MGREGPHLSLCIRRTASGIPLLVENLEHLRSVTIGVWARVGSRHESPEVQGVSHMVEHLLFKGTRRRGARAIAQVLENVGGELNAFTSREYSCFYARVAWEKLDLAVDVLSDLLQNPTFPKEELDRERRVILEEIAMYEDQPDDQVHEDMTSCMFDESLGHPIVGTRDVVAGVTRDTIRDYYRSRYVPENLFITVVGKLPRGGVRLLQEAFQKGGRRGRGAVSHPPATFRAQSRVRTKDIEQLHMCMALAGLPITHADRYALHLLSNHLGGGMASQLFQEIREKRGLAYTVYSFVQSYADTGLFGVYAATRPSKLGEVADLTLAELDKVASRGVTARRLQQLQDMVCGSLQLGLEKAGARMSRMGVGYYYHRKVVPIDDVVRQVRMITPDDMRRVAATVFLRHDDCGGPPEPRGVRARDRSPEGRGPRGARQLGPSACGLAWPIGQGEGGPPCPTASS